MEILRIKVYLTDNIQIRGYAQQVVMLPFTGACESVLFQGKILPGGVDTQRIEADGRCFLSARYALSGVDCEEKPCMLFIENTALAMPGEEMKTCPVIRTDSEALRWLETADLTGRIEHCSDHIEIVISSENRPGVEHITLKRGGLLLRGCLEKKSREPGPLVLMLHGFGGRMDACPGGWFQEYSDALTAAGMATLRFDFNGHGQSEGRFVNMTPYNEIEDAAAFLEYALAREDVTEVYLLGHSQGGVVAGMLAGYYHDHVKKLVMLAPAASLKTDAQQGKCMAAVYDAQHIPPSVLVGPQREVGGLFFRMAQTLPIYEVTSRFKGEAMAVIAGKDGVVFGDNIRRYGECMPNCRVIEYPELDHGLGGADHQRMLVDVPAFLMEKDDSAT